MQTLSYLGNEMPYPGRFIILGCNGTHLFNVYGVTARSPVNKCRRYVFNHDQTSVSVESTDPELMSQGDLTLLDYKAVQLFEDGLIVSNGRQINSIPSLNQADAASVLTKNLVEAEYEHDKYHTPRITGCTMQTDGVWTQALHIVRDNGSGESERNTFNLQISPSSAHFISTYAGPNVRPTPYFQGPPKQIEPLMGDAQSITESVKEAFSPRGSESEDVLVSIVTILIDKSSGDISSFILNTVDL